MNVEKLKGYWNSFEADIKKTYANVANDQELKTRANLEKFKAYMQKHYGITKDKANELCDEFGKDFK